jgi:hypothetical protein
MFRAHLAVMRRAVVAGHAPGSILAVVLALAVFTVLSDLRAVGAEPRAGEGTGRRLVQLSLDQGIPTGALSERQADMEADTKEHSSFDVCQPYPVGWIGAADDADDLTSGAALRTGEMRRTHETSFGRNGTLTHTMKETRVLNLSI